MNEREIHSLIALLDDDDQEVLEHVQGKLLSLGKDAIPVLESEWSKLQNVTQQDRLTQIVHRIQYSELLKEFRDWYRSPEHDLLTGICLIARYRYPTLNPQDIINQIDKIRLDIWLDMHHDLSPYEKVRIINSVVYHELGFKGNTENYHAPDNSFINVVLESRRGNPIMMAVIYILLGQRLHLPIFGVNLPQHFVCAYKEENKQLLLNDPFNLKTQHDYREGRVLFYINAFNNGAVFSKANLEQFLRQIKIEPQPDYFEACGNLSIVKRILRNLVVAYEKQQDTEKADDVKELLLAVGETYFSYNEEAPPEEEEE
jgi:regulator of sirC expression with transglutaminase-like and TPR domain